MTKREAMPKTNRVPPFPRVVMIYVSPSYASLHVSPLYFCFFVCFVPPVGKNRGKRAVELMTTRMDAIDNKGNEIAQ